MLWSMYAFIIITMIILHDNLFIDYSHENRAKTVLRHHVLLKRLFLWNIGFVEACIPQSLILRSDGFIFQASKLVPNGVNVHLYLYAVPDCSRVKLLLDRALISRKVECKLDLFRLFAVHVIFINHYNLILIRSLKVCFKMLIKRFCQIA